MLMSGYLRNIGENIRAAQKGLDDVEDVATYARTRPPGRGRRGAPVVPRSTGARSSSTG